MPKHWHDPGDKGCYAGDVEQDVAKLMRETDVRLPSLMKLTKRDLRILAMALSDAVETIETIETETVRSVCRTLTAR